MIWFSCSKCGKILSRSETSAGALVFCDCGQGNTVPWESTVTAPAEPLAAAPAASVPPPLGPESTDDGPIPVVRPVTSEPRDGETVPGNQRAMSRDGNVCFNHPDRPGQEPCIACGENFCGDCLVTLKGQPLCGPCKNFRLRETTKPSAVSGKAVLGVVLAMGCAPLVMCGSAFGSGAALFVGGLALLGQLTAILLGAMALVETEKNPRLSGRSLAITTLLTGGLATVVTICFMLFMPH